MFGKEEAASHQRSVCTQFWYDFCPGLAAFTLVCIPDKVGLRYMYIMHKLLHIYTQDGQSTIYAQYGFRVQWNIGNKTTLGTETK